MNHSSHSIAISFCISIIGQFCTSSVFSFAPGSSFSRCSSFLVPTLPSFNISVSTFSTKRPTDDGTDDSNHNSNKVNEENKGSSGPPDDNKTLGYYVQDDWWKDGFTEQQKEGLNGIGIRSLRRNPKYRRAVQIFLAIDLNHFLNTGEAILLESKSRLFGRMPPSDFGFNVKLAHKRDLSAFLNRLEEVRDWHNKDHIRDSFLSPILPIVQSSGTGKSRIMVEAKKMLEKENVACRTILLTSSDTSTASVPESQFDHQYSLPFRMDENEELKHQDSFRAMIFNQCQQAADDRVGTNSSETDVEVILFFDEAQHLTFNNGYMLRVLRWILRERPVVGIEERKYRIVAVLAGTTLSLTNFFPERYTPAYGSRCLEDTDSHFQKGTIPFAPFFLFRTMGCIGDFPNGNGQNGRMLTEYQTMIRFGRPLFAAMHSEDMLGEEAIHSIAENIVLGKPDSLPQDSCLSVLGTRIQMGQTSPAVVSDLISKGYAHLTSFQQPPSEDSKVPTQATFAFLPDPVCARISMALMDASFRFEGRKRTNSRQIQGRAPEWWSRQMGDMFSNGLCQANQGDFGKTASALFLLFCGDRLRKEADATYQTFSVDLKSWLKIIVSHCVREEENTSGLDNESIKGIVNFIQVVWHPLHLPLATFGSSEFLSGLYCKACAIYAPSSLKAVDLIIPCKVSDNNYVPIFVSVKNYASVSPGQANDWISNSLQVLHSDGVTKGLLLLCVIGQDRPDVHGPDYKNVLGKSATDDLTVFKDTLQECGLSFNISDMDEKLVPKVFYIHNDEFGIHKAITSSKAQKRKQEADVFAMHHEILSKKSTGWLGSNDEEEIEKLLPSNYCKDAKDLFQETLWCVQHDEQDE